MKVGLIGFGNMAQAMVKGWLKEKVLSPDQIYATASRYEALKERAAAYGIHALSSNRELAEMCDVIVLAVKPYMIAKATEGCLEAVKSKMIISVAAGMPFEKIEEILPGTRHISIVPNTPISVGQGIVVTEQKNSLDEEQRKVFEWLFEKTALIAVVPTAQLSVAGTIAGCSPAFAAVFIEALGDAGVKYGLQRKQAYELAAKVLEGTGAMYMENPVHPGAMKDAVCSPGGTTIRGVSSLEKNGFRGDIIDAVDAIEGK